MGISAAYWRASSISHPGPLSSRRKGALGMGRRLCRRVEPVIITRPSWTWDRRYASRMSPQCLLCPLLDLCQAFPWPPGAAPAAGSSPKNPSSTRRGGGRRPRGLVLIAQRAQTGLLGGMWEFPGGKLQVGEELPACLRREIHEELGVDVCVGEELGVYRHAYTHFKVTLHAFFCRLERGEPAPLRPASSPGSAPLPSPTTQWARSTGG